LTFADYLAILPNSQVCIFVITGTTRSEDKMDSKVQAKYESRAKIIKAMGHPTRLFIVDQLSNKEKCVCELTKMIGADMSTVSKHLSVLRNVGIIQMEKRGTQVYYQLKMPCIMKFFGCVESVIRQTAQEQLELVK